MALTQVHCPKPPPSARLAVEALPTHPLKTTSKEEHHPAHHAIEEEVALVASSSCGLVQIASPLNSHPHRGRDAASSPVHAPPSSPCQIFFRLTTGVSGRFNGRPPMTLGAACMERIFFLFPHTTCGRFAAMWPMHLEYTPLLVPGRR
jgi:hypothetical protein